MKLAFTKMHGCGNNYIYFNCFDQTVPDPESLSIKLSEPHFGIGGDGIILISPSDKADAQMRIFNADGSEGKMCGNGIRCVGKYLYDNGMTDGRTTITIDTLSGVKTLELTVKDGKMQSARVYMGAAILAPREIPVDMDGENVISAPIVVDEKVYHMTCVSMGNPHCVIFQKEDVDDLDLTRIGPKFEHHPLFPERVNTEFVNVLPDGSLKMRVWERGSGETWACGTGSCERGGKQRSAEVERHIDAEHARDAACDVDAAGKIAVQLNAVKQNTERNDSTAVGTVLHDDVVYQNSRAVGDDDFFEVTPERQLNADLQVVPAQLALCGKLRRQLIETADRSLHHLREERYKQTVAQRIALGRIFAAVHVNNVAHGLENEKRQTERHDKIPSGNVIAERGRQQLEREIPVFHRVEQAKTADRANYRDLLLFVLYLGLLRLVGRLDGVIASENKSGYPGHSGHQNHPRKRLDRAGHVKRCTRQQQDAPLRLFRHDVVEQHARDGEYDKRSGSKSH